MNPISFQCSHCSQSITVPPDAAGRAVPCQHCKQATLAPALLAVAVPIRDQGPDFTETLRKAREATDSIFHDNEDEGDSLFGGNDTPRKLIVPSHAASVTPPLTSDPNQATLRVPGLPELPPVRSLSTPTATRAAYVPEPVLDNPFEDLITETSLEGSSNMQPSGPMVEEEEAEEVAVEEAEPKPFPWKNLLIIALVFYALLITGVAAWGWLRTAPAKAAVPPVVNKH